MRQQEIGILNVRAVNEDILARFIVGNNETEMPLDVEKFNSARCHGNHSFDLIGFALGLSAAPPDRTCLPRFSIARRNRRTSSATPPCCWKSTSLADL